MARKLVKESASANDAMMEIATREGPMETFDLRDTIIPFSLLQIANYFQQMKANEEIEIYGNEAGIAEDLKSILPASAVTICRIDSAADERPHYRWRLKKITPYHPNPKGGASCLESI
jgi:TusA-related sulfurtransferase